MICCNLGIVRKYSLVGLTTKPTFKIESSPSFFWFTKNSRWNSNEIMSYLFQCLPSRYLKSVRYLKSRVLSLLQFYYTNYPVLLFYRIRLILTKIEGFPPSHINISDLGTNRFNVCVVATYLASILRKNFLSP